MPKVEEVIELVEKFAPLETQAKWDNSGWQINLGKPEFKKIMTALTVTEDVVKQAADKGCDFILAHHPLIFEPLTMIEPGAVLDAIKAGIQIYSAHTSLDLAKGGTTDTLSEKCGFGICPAVEDFITGKQLENPIDLEFLKEDIKKKLQLDCLKIINFPRKIPINILTGEEKSIKMAVSTSC